MYIRFHIYCTIGLADFQVLPPGLNVIDHKGLQVEPNDFQLRGTYQFTAVCVCVGVRACMCVYVGCIINMLYVCTCIQLYVNICCRTTGW